MALCIRPESAPYNQSPHLKPSTECCKDRYTRAASAPNTFDGFREANSPLELLISGRNNLNSDFRRKLHAYVNLRRIITWGEWGLLSWSSRKLTSITAEHGEGPTTWSQDIKDKQLTQLLWDREVAWLKIASMYIAWEEVLATGGSLRKAFELYEQAGKSAYGGQYKERAKLHDYNMYELRFHDPRRWDHMKSLTLAPDVPEFKAIYSCLPRWINDGKAYIRAGTKYKIGYISSSDIIWTCRCSRVDA
ncbi:hypothetical protein WJX74_003815 [Apatococcus lobatus]|uniref:Uncharacterized protein n=1 Tax=Apatococcus lobatus TaxID=904363 RepID=A0AAW1QCN1_9CHLO